MPIEASERVRIEAIAKLAQDVGEAIKESGEAWEKWNREYRRLADLYMQRPVGLAVSIPLEDALRVVKHFEERSTEAEERVLKAAADRGSWANGYWSGTRDAFEEAERMLKAELGIREWRKPE